MKILIVSTFFPPLNSIASLRPYSWAKEWSKLGHEVTVLTMDHDQDPSLRLDLPIERWRTVYIPAPSVLRAMRSAYRQTRTDTCHTQSNKGLARFKGLMRRSIATLFQKGRERYGIFSACRMPDFTDFWILPALKAVDNQEVWDLVVSTSGPYAVHLLAYTLKRKKRALSWIADYRDLWNGNHMLPGLFPFNRIEAALEKKLLRSADRLTTVSESLADDLCVLHRRKNVHVIENGFDSDDLEKLDPQPIFEDDGKYRLVYSGSFYPGKTDPSLLFEVIQAMADKPELRQVLNSLEVIFVGTASAHLLELVERYGISSWVKYSGFVSRPDSLRMQRDAHALLFMPFHNGVLTGKLFEYLFSGTPILALGYEKLDTFEKMIVKSGAGQIFYDRAELIEFLIRALSSPVKRKSAVTKEFLEAYERGNLARRFLVPEGGTNEWK